MARCAPPRHSPVSSRNARKPLSRRHRRRATIPLPAHLRARALTPPASIILTFSCYRPTAARPPPAHHCPPTAAAPRPRRRASPHPPHVHASSPASSSHQLPPPPRANCFRHRSKLCSQSPFVVSCLFGPEAVATKTAESSHAVSPPRALLATGCVLPCPSDVRIIVRRITVQRRVCNLPRPHGGAPGEAFGGVLGWKPGRMLGGPQVRK